MNVNRFLIRRNLAYERLRRPSQAVTHRLNLEPQVLARDVQIAKAVRGYILVRRSDRGEAACDGLAI